ncbi:hypothetical protein IQ273_26340 [Nodosilinea sp. LEGE 07298]|uniref:hypothetical protein n=1 Tax=Nodosilinea sp. LEGE 07298 TaxID=2777970 RepID=UPI00187DE63C|nr:hypothetical protein [Nodosilinea sp. LEGE 07298]MBE9112911.1 hypothetical protein [Nodosilinea sp. LEGE 07298]
MPDGDIVHNGLGRLYKKPYQQLCEGKANSDECAQVMLEALKKDLIQRGDLPIRLCQEMSNFIIQALSSGDEFSAQKYAELSMSFDELSYHLNGRPDLKKLALDAGKSILHDLRYGERIDSENVFKELSGRYISEVYQSEFKEKVPLTPQHHAGIDANTLDQRIAEIQPYIDKAIDTWSNKIVSDGSVSRLRMPPRQRLGNELDLQGDSMAKHNHRNHEKLAALLSSNKFGSLQITTQDLKKYFSQPCEVDWDES